jgi:hypothetical protein
MILFQRLTGCGKAVDKLFKKSLTKQAQDSQQAKRIVSPES